MGLFVSSDKQVFFDPDRELRLNTSIHTNPRSQRYVDVLVYSIFLRLHTKSNGQDNSGDGNPLIFALKHLNGFSISPDEWLKFRPNKLTIIQKIINEHPQFDGIICLPSSKSVVFDTACEINQFFNLPLPIYKDCLVKKSASEIYIQLQNKLKLVPKKHKSKFTRELSKLSRIKEGKDYSFSMKSVDRQIRPYISCLTLKEQTPIDPNGRYILVDDLISSGSTLISAITCLVEYGVSKDNLLGISLLSKI